MQLLFWRTKRGLKMATALGFLMFFLIALSAIYADKMGAKIAKWTSKPEK